MNDNSILDLSSKSEEWRAGWEARERWQGHFGIWRGLCGHYWNKAENDDCPICPQVELQRLWGATDAALPEGWRVLIFRTMSGDVLGYGVEAAFYAESGEMGQSTVFEHGPTLAVALRLLLDRLDG